LKKVEDIARIFRKLSSTTSASIPDGQNREGGQEKLPVRVVEKKRGSRLIFETRYLAFEGTGDSARGRKETTGKETP